ncbi:MAG TPA: glycosyltransferase family 39 protein [Acidobacteriaceae bacterium]|nr:glycosyltransferase family 39 protein [Acidobacteriaceae bacterium]
MDKTSARARIVCALWIACLLALFGLHFVHLLADFPNNSPWMDYSKYTDEGWYASAAVRFRLTGHWFLRGDFNPAVALPVWPLLMALVFRFTGVSLLAARVVILLIFGVNLLLSYRILRAQAARWAALLAVTLLVTSPFLFAFSRLAILEPLVTCFQLLSWNLALRMREATGRARYWLPAALGLDLCFMVLAKTTGIFLIPSTLFLLAWSCRGRRETLRALSVACAIGIAVWCTWFFLLVRPNYLPAYRYFFEANTWPQPVGLAGHMAAYWYALHGALWISPVLGIVVAVLLALTLVPHRTPAASRETNPPSLSFWRNPLVVACLLAAGGYIFFIGWENHPQPRYYETVIYPLSWLLALAVAALVARRRALPLRIAGAAALAVLFGVCVSGAVSIAGYIRHPEYTWLSAAHGIARYIETHPAPNRIVLSISGDDLSLMTHLPAICDDFGPWDLAYRIHVYQPSWYAAWNDLDPGTVADISTQYSLQQVAQFPAFDDPDRDDLVLYRMIPLPPARQHYLAQQEEQNNTGK